MPVGKEEGRSGDNVKVPGTSDANAAVSPKVVSTGAFTISKSTTSRSYRSSPIQMAGGRYLSLLLILFGGTENMGVDEVAKPRALVGGFERCNLWARGQQRQEISRKVLPLSSGLLRQVCADVDGGKSWSGTSAKLENKQGPEPRERGQRNLDRRCDRLGPNFFLFFLYPLVLCKTTRDCANGMNNFNERWGSVNHCEFSEPPSR